MTDRRVPLRLDRLLDAQLFDAPGRVDLTLSDGVVVDRAIAGAGGVASTSGRQEGCDLAVDSRVVVPAFVDAHIHLDKAYLLGHAALAAELPTDAPVDVATVIEMVGRLRDVVPLCDVRSGAERAIDALVFNGTTAARVHVEVDPAIGLDFVELHQVLAGETSARCHLQLVAFPQRGLELPGAADLLAAAMKEGLDVVGGCPYVDDDPGRHLDIVFELAERYGAPVDLHLDFSDDPGRSLLDMVVARTRAHGMSGLVNIGHVTTLAAMSPTARAAALAMLADHGISLVVLPVTDLHLAGNTKPATRSVAPVLEAVAAGVRVAVGNNNVANPFAPFGNANLVLAAWLSGVLERATDESDHGQLLRSITSAPATILGLPRHGPEVGAVADLAVLDTTDPTMSVRGAPAISATIHNGRLVHLADTPVLTVRG